MEDGWSWSSKVYLVCYDLSVSEFKCPFLDCFIMITVGAAAYIVKNIKVRDVGVVLVNDCSSLCAMWCGKIRRCTSQDNQNRDYSNADPAETWMGVDSPILSGFALSCTIFQLLSRCLGLSLSSFPGGQMNHMALVGGALQLLGCPRTHVRLMYQSPRDFLRLWLGQPTVCSDSGSFHRGTLPLCSPSWVLSWIAKVM